MALNCKDVRDYLLAQKADLEAAGWKIKLKTSGNLNKADEDYHWQQVSCNLSEFEQWAESNNIEVHRED